MQNLRYKLQSVSEYNNTALEHNKHVVLVCLRMKVFYRRDTKYPLTLMTKGFVVETEHETKYFTCVTKANKYLNTL